MENQIKKNPYTFKKDAWHTKLFFWIWGVNVSKKFKTMCPYFWSWIGTIAIIPIIILVKLLRIPSGKFADFVVRQLENCKEFTNSIRIASEERKEKARTIRKLKMVEEFKIYLKDQNIKSAHELDLKITAMKEFTFNSIMQSYIYSLETQEERDRFYNSNVYYRYFELLDEKRNQDAKAEELKVPETSIYEEFKTEGTTLNYVFMIISVIFAIIGILCIGYVFYYVIVNFVIPHIIFILIVAAMITGVIALMLGIIAFLQCWGDIIMENIKSFFLKIGNFIKPLGKVFMIFIWIGTFFKLTWGVIHAIYKKNCPIINWED